MLRTFFARAHVLARLEGGPVSAHLVRFAAALQEEKYAPETARHYLRGADGFGRWLARRGCAVEDADDRTVADYLEVLGRRCHPRYSRGRLPEAAFGVKKFVELLRKTGVMPVPTSAPRTEIEEWLAAFDRHLDSVCGASVSTRREYLHHARGLLVARFGTATAVDWAALTADEVVQLVREQAEKARPSACGSPVGIVTASRSFLRFLVFVGAIRPGLETVVPTIRRPKLAALPEHLTAEEVERTLATCRQTTPLGRRDRAILMLLSRLGLRASEVMRLRLDDIDWRQGRLAIRAGKSGRERQLPLPQDIGRVVVDYLKHGRPKSTDRTVFLRSRPPYRGLKTSLAITVIARMHLKLAGVKAHHLGAHILRHTAATGMVRRGVAFKEVADVLGHRLLETTAIYAKLDAQALAGVALPWPGATV